MIYDVLKAQLGSATLDLTHTKTLAALEIELETLEAELAEWESVCGVCDEDAA